MRELQQVVQTLRLTIGVVDVDVKWKDQVVDECGLVVALSLVGSVDGTGPVCPVDVILKHSDTSDVVLTHNYRHKTPNKKCQTKLSITK